MVNIMQLQKQNKVTLPHPKNHQHSSQIWNERNKKKHLKICVTITFNYIRRLYSDSE